MTNLSISCHVLYISVNMLWSLQNGAKCHLVIKVTSHVTWFSLESSLVSHTRTRDQIVIVAILALNCTLSVLWLVGVHCIFNG